VSRPYRFGEVVGRLAPLQRLAWLSPFHYDDPIARLMGAPPKEADVRTLVGVGAADVAIAYVVYGRRDR
jgi:hypothetical protein